MINRVRDVRKSKGLTLEDVALRCVPATTAQTIGRLETGMRTMSIGWLNRIAEALEVDTSELVKLAAQEEIAIAAILSDNGVHALSTPSSTVPPLAGEGVIAMKVECSTGDYRNGDEIWLSTKYPDDYANALNCDILVPRPGGRFIFGRLIGRDDEKLHILPFENGARQQVVKDPNWIAVTTRLIRTL